MSYYKHTPETQYITFFCDTGNNWVDMPCGQLSSLIENNLDGFTASTRTAPNGKVIRTSIIFWTLGKNCDRCENRSKNCVFSHEVYP